MAQHINLYSPILLSKKRYFSALALAQALLVIAVGIVALSTWTVLQNNAVRAELQLTERNNVAERTQLMTAIAANPALATDTTALEQTLKTLQAAVEQREQTLAELTDGLVTDGRSHSAMLRLVAETVPGPVWLTQVRLSSGRLEVAGMTLEPAALRPWIQQLSADPLLAGQQLGTVQVERAEAATPGARPLPQGLEAWVFRLANATPPPPPAQPASAPTNVPNATAIADNAIANMAASIPGAASAASAVAAAASGVQP